MLKTRKWYPRWPAGCRKVISNPLTQQEVHKAWQESTPKRLYWFPRINYYHFHMYVYWFSFKLININKQILYFSYMYMILVKKSVPILGLVYIWGYWLYTVYKYYISFGLIKIKTILCGLLVFYYTIFLGFFVSLFFYFT